MIKFHLHCACGSVSEAWFPDEEDYREQNRAGLVVCPSCQTHHIEARLPTEAATVASTAGTDAPHSAPESKASVGSDEWLNRLAEKLSALCGPQTTVSIKSLPAPPPSSRARARSSAGEHTASLSWTEFASPTTPPHSSDALSLPALSNIEPAQEWVETLEEYDNGPDPDALLEGEGDDTMNATAREGAEQSEHDFTPPPLSHRSAPSLDMAQPTKPRDTWAVVDQKSGRLIETDDGLERASAMPQEPINVANYPAPASRKMWRRHKNLRPDRGAAKEKQDEASSAVGEALLEAHIQEIAKVIFDGMLKALGEEDRAAVAIDEKVLEEKKPARARKKTSAPLDKAQDEAFNPVGRTQRMKKTSAKTSTKTSTKALVQKVKPAQDEGPKNMRDQVGSWMAIAVPQLKSRLN